jgi:hypothetical protein
MVWSIVWSLIRNSPAWRIAGWASLIYAAGWLILSQGADRGGADVSAPIIIFMGFLVAIGKTPETISRSTFFDAALPVEGRQLWVSKMITLLAMVWLPVLAASAVGFVVVHDPALPLLNAGAGFTAILLAAQCFRIREFREPLGASVSVFIGGGTLMIAISVVLPNSAMPVLAGYLAANVLFFLLAWSRVPKCFEAAPTQPSAARQTRETVRAEPRPILVWWKILRPTYLSYLFVLLVLVWLEGGATFVSVITIVPPVAATARGNWRFLAHLPVLPRKLFWAIWAPLPLAIFLGYEGAIHFPLGPLHPAMLGPRVTAIAWSISLALLLSWMFCFQSAEWRRMRNWPMAAKVIVMATIPVGVTVAWISIPSNDFWRRYGVDPIPYFAVKVAAVLPENPWMLATVLVVPLVGLYYLAERTFCEMEYSVTRTMGESYFGR